MKSTMDLVLRFGHSSKGSKDSMKEIQNLLQLNYKTGNLSINNLFGQLIINMNKTG